MQEYSGSRNSLLEIYLPSQSLRCFSPRIWLEFTWCLNCIISETLKIIKNRFIGHTVLEDRKFKGMLLVSESKLDESWYSTRIEKRTQDKIRCPECLDFWGSPLLWWGLTTWIKTFSNWKRQSTSGQTTTSRLHHLLLLLRQFRCNSNFRRVLSFFFFFWNDKFHN